MQNIFKVLKNKKTFTGILDKYSNQRQIVCIFIITSQLSFFLSVDRNLKINSIIISYLFVYVLV